jgi:hypothetical protein
LRSLQEIQPDFEEEAKAYAGLWSQGKKERMNGSLGMGQTPQRSKSKRGRERRRRNKKQTN